MVAAVMIVPTLSLPGIAFAEQPSDPPPDSGSPSCFGDYARTTKEVPDAGPGTSVSSVATTLADTLGGNPHSAQVANMLREDFLVC